MTETTTAEFPAPAPVPALNIPVEQQPAAETTPPQGADTNKPDARAEGESDDQTKDKPRKGASERIGELYGRMKSAERERDQALAEVERLRKPVVDAKEWDGLSFDQQQSAQVRQAVRTERADELEREAEHRARDAAEQRAAMFAERVKAVADTIPDIEAVISDQSLPVSETGARFIQESEKGPQVAYWLGQNRAEAARIARMEPLQQAFELGRIEQRISAAPTAKRVSTAPAPVPTVGGGGSPGPKSPDTMSVGDMAEFLRSKGLVR